MTSASKQAIKDVYDRYRKLTAEERDGLALLVELAPPEPAPKRGRPRRVKGEPLLEDEPA